MLSQIRTGTASMFHEGYQALLNCYSLIYFRFLATFTCFKKKLVKIKKTQNNISKGF